MPRQSKSGVEGAHRGSAIQDQIDSVMDSFDFSTAVKLNNFQNLKGSGRGEKTLRQTARRVMAEAVSQGGWAMGGGFSAFLIENKNGKYGTEVKLLLFFGASSLLEPSTFYDRSGFQRGAGDSVSSGGHDVG
jgi:hypothetical protein